MSSLRCTALTLLTIGMVSCAVMRPAPPEVQLAGLEITDMSLSHANFLATLRLYNPNQVDLEVERIQFTLFLNDVQVADGLTAETFALPALKSGNAVIHLSSSFLDLLQLTRTLQDRNELSFRIAGKIKIGGYGLFGTTIPVERQGSLPLTGTLNQLLPHSKRPSAR